MLNNQLRLHPAGVLTQVGNLLSHTGNSPKISDCKGRGKMEKLKSKMEKIETPLFEAYQMILKTFIINNKNKMIYIII
jgi:hypothetical protein